jgi:hypothetical protein
LDASQTFQSRYFPQNTDPIRSEPDPSHKRAEASQHPIQSEPNRSTSEPNRPNHAKQIAAANDTQPLKPSAIYTVPIKTPQKPSAI